MPVTSFCLRCVCLIPYSLVCVCLYFLGCVERLARYVCEHLPWPPHEMFIDYSIHCQCLPYVSTNDSDLLSSKMRTMLARELQVSATCRCIWQSMSSSLCDTEIVISNHELCSHFTQALSIHSHERGSRICVSIPCLKRFHIEAWIQAQIRG